MPRIKLVYIYEIIAFIAGFCLMVYELVASRLLAPTIGSSTYVWTSVIGVIIAALAAGYAVGGWLADKRVAKQDIAWLLLAASSTGLATLVCADVVLAAASEQIADARLQGLLASLLLFMPTSFVLGAISPYLVRLRNHSVTTTGRSVASLGALNSVGGIVGTFCAGFIFFGYMGTRETLGLVIVLLLATSWLIVPRHRTGVRFIAAFALLGGLGLQFMQQPAVQAIELDTPSAHYRIFDGEYRDRPVRVLTMGPGGLQSGIYLDSSKGLVFDYARQMAAVVAQSPHKQRILILGGGAFTLPQHLADRYPNSQVDVVEIDPKLLGIAKEYFHYQSPANVRVIAEDARTFLAHNRQQYDVILVDVYSDIAIPFPLATTEYAQDLRRAVKPEGAVVANVIGANNPKCAPLLNSLHASYAGKFAQYRVFPLGDVNLLTHQNIIVVYSPAGLAWLDELQPTAVQLIPGERLTDNFAPIERLQQRCRS